MNPMKYPGVQKLIDVLKAVDNSEKSQMGFDMGHWYDDRHATNHSCGTACCIGGWAKACLIAQKGYSPSASLAGFTAVEEFCGLQESNLESQLADLTIPDQPFDELTLEMAIRVLEIFRDTGEVQWREVYNEMKGDDANVSSIS